MNLYRGSLSLTCCLLMFGVALVAAGCGGGAKTDPKSDPKTDSKAAKAAAQQDPESAKLIGVWEGSEKPTTTINGKKVEAQGEPITVKFEFRGDGALAMDIPFFPAPVRGTWKVLKSEGSKLTVATVLEMPSFSFESKTVNDKASSKTDIQTKKEEDTFTIVFETADRIVMTPAKMPDEPLTLQRKK